MVSTSELQHRLNAMEQEWTERMDERDRKLEALIQRNSEKLSEELKGKFEEIMTILTQGRRQEEESNNNNKPWGPNSGGGERESGGDERISPTLMVQISQLGERGRFDESLFDDPISEMMNLKQMNSVDEYMERLKTTHTPSHPKTEMHTLKHRAILQSKTYYHLETLRPAKPPYINPTRAQSDNTSHSASNHNPHFTNSHLPNNSSSAKPVYIPPHKQNRNTRTVDQATVAERRSKGLCISCGEKYTYNHRCKNAKLYALIVEDVVEEEGCDDKEEGILREVGPEVEESGEEVHISLNAIQGFQGADEGQTMKVKGLIKKQEVNFLMDTWSTHNFLSDKLMKSLGLKSQTTRRYKVAVANEQTIVVSFRCENLKWSICEWDCDKLYMRFNYRGHEVFLRGVGAKIDMWYEDDCSCKSTVQSFTVLPSGGDHALQRINDQLMTTQTSEHEVVGEDQLLVDQEKLLQSLLTQLLVDYLWHIISRQGVSMDENKKLQSNDLDSSKYTWEGEVLKRKGKIVVGNDPSLRQQMLEVFHGSPWGGHS
ncbi:Aspartic peptidase domain superfamily [Sesbania bispinosa]|nr:Aspartic peptidase domain superfamily [Sesbania bispinosa]